MTLPLRATVLALTFLLAIAAPVAAAPFELNLNNSPDTPPPPAKATIHVVQVDGQKNTITLDSFGVAQGNLQCRTANGTGAGPVALAANSYMCSMQAAGWDGAGYGSSPGGSVAFRAGGDWTTGSHPTWFKVELTPRGSTTNILPFFITPEGHWGHASARLPSDRPTLSGCGTGASLDGDDNGGRITIGEGPSEGCVVTFAAGWRNTDRQGDTAPRWTRPACEANNETSPELLRATQATPQSVTLAGTLRAGDQVTFDCRQLGNG